MPKNFRGGNKTKRGKNIPRNNTSRILRKKKEADLEIYGKIISRLGGNPPIVKVIGEDKKERNCVVRGKFQKKVWMNPGDIVLIICNTDIGESGEVAWKYNETEVSLLEQCNEIVSTSFGDNDDDDLVQFTNDTDQLNIFSSEGNQNDNDLIDFDDI